MAREGLRTLVVAKKMLTEEQYQDFEVRLHTGKKKYNEKEKYTQEQVSRLSINQSNFYSANIPGVARLSGATARSVFKWEVVEVVPLWLEGYISQ